MVEIAHTVCELVLPQNDFPVIIGLDWFKETDAGFYPSKNIIKIDGRLYHLDGRFIGYAEVDENLLSIQSITMSYEAEELIIGVDIDEKADHEIHPTAKLDKGDMDKFNVLKMQIQKIIPKGPEELGLYKEEIEILLTDRTPVFRGPYRKSNREHQDRAEIADYARSRYHRGLEIILLITYSFSPNERWLDQNRPG